MSEEQSALTKEEKKELGVYKKRMESLMGTLGAYQAEVGASGVSRLKIFNSLLGNLQEFAGQHFDYFWKGFGCEAGSLVDDLIKEKDGEPDQVYPCEYALTVILDQIAYDFEVIQRAIQQRLSPTFRGYLEIADRLAQDALQPAIDKGLVKEGTTVVTYFQKSASIQVIPYAPVALIAVPFTCMAVDQDYLSIPHEVGHYVFWNGSTNGKKEMQPIPKVLFSALQAKDDFPKWCIRWAEEIFADVYGCLVAGPVIALDFQELLFQKPPKRFYEDDQVHPAPVIRPYIYTTVLKKQSKWGEIPTDLDEKWFKRRGKRRGQGDDSQRCISPKIPEDFVLAAHTRDKLPKVSGIISEQDPVKIKDKTWVGQVIRDVFSILGDIDYQGWSGAEPEPESKTLQKKGNNSSVLLYDEFGDYIEPTKLNSDSLTEAKWDGWAKQFFALGVSRPDSFADLDLEQIKSVIRLLSANGWITKGPTDVWHP